MDNRLYFSLGDLAANVVTGAVVACLIALLVGPGWNMLVAMLVAMALGMALGLPLSIPFGYLFGAMEIMLPIMLTGMLSGMVVGMWAAMEEVGLLSAAMGGAFIGLITINAVWLVNQRLRGPQIGEPEATERDDDHG